MKWTHCEYLHSECYISGIYRVTWYRPGQYLAFYIVDGQKNWGDFVAPPPDRSADGGHCWLSLEAAMQACSDHAAKHEPKPATVKRAAELLATAKPITEAA
jgi:hypothetical protein